MKRRPSLKLASVPLMHAVQRCRGCKFLSVFCYKFPLDVRINLTDIEMSSHSLRKSSQDRARESRFVEDLDKIALRLSSAFSFLARHVFEGRLPCVLSLGPAVERRMVLLHDPCPRATSRANANRLFLTGRQGTRIGDNGADRPGAAKS